MDSRYCRSQWGAFLYHQSLASFKWLTHGFSLRSGSQKDVEQSLGVNFYQNREIVLRNRQQFIQALVAAAGIRGDGSAAGDPGEKGMARLVLLRQCHSDLIHTLTQSPPAEFFADGDGLVTDRQGLLLSVLTADCMPVLIADIKNRVVAAVHAGWRGTAKRIIEKTLAKMERQFASSPENCIAVIGPAIRGCCYEVGEEVFDAFQQFDYAASLFQIRSKGKQSLDLPTAGRFQLLRAGLKGMNIFSDPPCTACNLDQFFSHRGEHGRTGRMMGVIGIVASGNR
jgi:polyphenol oxidase